jgi:tRNA pseudouridine38-40 synthase
MRIALGLEYDGAQFCGWQSQAAGCGVQDCLERALQHMVGHELRVSAAGRTDSGVHALCQVVHFDTMTMRPLNAWVRGANAHLPPTLRVLWAQNVDENFHARFSAERRSYQYLLINQPVAPAVMYGRAGWFHLPLDAQAMQRAADYLVGEHDFSAFRAAECQAKTPVKHLHQARIQRNGDHIVFNFSANAFLHHQVRNMVGALIYVGKGTLTPEQVRDLLQCRDRRQSPPTFAPGGLYLTGVTYAEHWSLPATQRSIYPE